MWVHQSRFCRFFEMMAPDNQCASRQNKLCEMMLEVFYDPLTANGGVTYRESDVVSVICTHALNL